MMLSVSLYYPFCITPSVSLTFMILSVFPGYQLLLVTPSVFSNVYDVVCVSGFSILDYPFGVSNVYEVVCVSGLSITIDFPFVFFNVYDVFCVSGLSITFDYPFGVLKRL